MIAQSFVDSNDSLTCLIHSFELVIGSSVTIVGLERRKVKRMLEMRGEEGFQSSCCQLFHVASISHCRMLNAPAKSFPCLIGGMGPISANAWLVKL